MTTKIALVGTGPSLEETWKELKWFGKIMTCSRAHDFLLERHIVPDYHVDIDPQLRKLPTRFSRSVLYLLGPGVHDAYRSAVPDAQILSRTGVQAGDTAVLAAYDLGYREIHCFGYDGSGAGEEDFVFDGKTYRVTENLLGSIYCFEQACMKCPGIKVTVHGDGLLRAYLDRKYGQPRK
jgi:uncharacterized Rossmann fold enzyme